MTILTMDREEVQQRKTDAEIRKLEKMQGELVHHIKVAIDMLSDLDHLYDLKEYIEDSIVEWEELELDEEDEDEGD